MKFKGEIICCGMEQKKKRIVVSLVYFGSFFYFNFAIPGYISLYFEVDVLGFKN